MVLEKDESIDPKMKIRERTGDGMISENVLLLVTRGHTDIRDGHSDPQDVDNDSLISSRLTSSSDTSAESKMKGLRKIIQEAHQKRLPEHEKGITDQSCKFESLKRSVCISMKMKVLHVQSPNNLGIMSSGRERRKRTLAKI